jgi:hypothetical protein
VLFDIDHEGRMFKKACSEAAGDENTAGVAISHPPNPEPAKTGSLPKAYVEDVFKPRTNHGKWRVLARLG